MDKNKTRIIKCKICNRKFPLKGFAVHLYRTHKNILYENNETINKQYFDKYCKIIDNICLRSGCGKLTHFRSLTFGYNLYCSNSCVGKDQHIKDKKKKSMIEHYGDNYQEKINEFRKQTNLEKYNNTCFFKTKRFYTESRETCMIKYGYENLNNPLTAKIRKVGQQRFYSNSDNIKKSVEKQRQTMLKKYGICDYSVINPNRGKSKKYIMPSGKEFIVRGFEPIVIDYLLKKCMISEYDIIINQKQIPHFKYINVDNKEHIYYPDIYIPRLNWIIEVKSRWTFKQEKEKNLLKRQYVINAGYKFNFIIR